VQRLVTNGHRGWPVGQTPCSASPTKQPLMCWLCGDTLQEAVEENPKLMVGGGKTPWLVGHMARPADPPTLACYRLNQVGNASLDPYKYL
jgi:hypothetical protein